MIFYLVEIYWGYDSKFANFANSESSFCFFKSNQKLFGLAAIVFVVTISSIISE